jgi:hypothetical protein
VVASVRAARKGLKPPSVWPGGGEVVEFLFRGLDLLQRRVVDVAGEGAVHHSFAEIDQLAPQIEVMTVLPKAPASMTWTDAAASWPR